jgi:DNA (cytosine-5)-methyltransferase 1
VGQNYPDCSFALPKPDDMLTSRPTAVDLFAGAGGATEGLRQAGYQVLAAIESDPRAVETLRRNHPATLVREARIEGIDAKRFALDIAAEGGDLTLLQACPPCQTWSSLGGHDAKDPRNELIFQVARFARALRPRIVIVENVLGLLKDPRLSKLRRQLRDAGYGVRAYRVEASQWGVPQRRRRLILIAIAGSDGRSLPRALLALVPSTFDTSRTTVSQALAVLPTDGDFGRHLAPLTLKRIRAIPEGGNRFDLPKNLQLRCHTRLRHRTATGAYGRMRGDDVAPTLTTRCTTVACGPFIHPTQDRPITLTEAAALQTFPTGYTFAGSHGQVERQIGNAIPVKLAQGLGLAVARILEGTQAKATTRRPRER